MKIIKITITILLFMTGITAEAQKKTSGEKYGKTLNLGVGLGYYGYIGHVVPVLHANFEIDVARNFTLAPFISYYSYRNDYYWGNKNYPYRNYSYRQTVVPIGIKGTYYFDQLFKANSDWDFYAAGSLGVAIIKSTWEDGYYGDRNVYRNRYSGTTPLYLDAHVGAEYHVSEKLGLFLDLSTGISTFGLGLHF